MPKIDRFFRKRRHMAALTLGALAAGCAQHYEADTPLPPPPSTRSSASPLTKPALPPLSQPSYQLSDVSTQTLLAQPAFAYVSTRTTFRDIGKTIEPAMSKLNAAVASGKLLVLGPPIFVYLGATEDLEKPFTLQIGFPVSVGAKPTETVLVRNLPAMKAITVTFGGPVSAIDKAYDKLIPRMLATRPTAETREVYLHWEGFQFDHNQILVAIGVE